MKRNPWLIVAAIILALIVISSLGVMIAFAAGAMLVYFGWRQAMLSDHAGGKILWWILAGVGLVIALSSLPGLIGFGALYLLYKCYEKWKEDGNQGTGHYVSV